MSTALEEALERYPRFELTRVPTPLQSLSTLSSRLGPQIFIKRDDLTDLTLGGDKPRKLEYEVAQALAQGADTLVTCHFSHILRNYMRISKNGEWMSCHDTTERLAKTSIKVSYFKNSSSRPDSLVKSGRDEVSPFVVRATFTADQT